MSSKFPKLAARARTRRYLPSTKQTIHGPWRIADGTGASATVIASITVTPTTRDDASDGLLAYLSLELDSFLRIDGLTLRLSERGKVSISYPARSSCSGQQHSIVRPVSPEARTKIERTIFEALALNSEAMSCE